MPCRIHSTVNRTCEHDQLSLPWLGYICGKRSFAHITKTPVISRLQVNEKGDSPGWAWSSQDEHLEDRELWNERGSLLALKRQLPVERAIWQEPQVVSKTSVWSLVMASKETGLQSYNHKEPNSASNQWAWKRTPSPEKITVLADSLISTCWDPEWKTQLGYACLTHRNCENFWCVFQLLSLW